MEESLINRHCIEDSRNSAGSIQQLFSLPECHLLLFKARRGMLSHASVLVIVAYIFLHVCAVYLSRFLLGLFNSLW